MKKQQVSEDTQARCARESTSPLTVKAQEQERTLRSQLAEREAEVKRLREALQQIADGQWNIDRRRVAELGVREFARAALAKEDGEP